MKINKTRVFLFAIALIFALCSAVPISAGAAPLSNDGFIALCQSGTRSEVERAIRAGANVNAANENGWTALHFAALYNDDPEVVKLLLENGANIDARDEYGDTPLMNAVISQFPRHILLLLNHGADPNVVNNAGETASDFLPEHMPDGDEEAWQEVYGRLAAQDPVSELGSRISQKYPNFEALKTQFGNQAEWQERTEPNMHDEKALDIIRVMNSPGIDISTLEAPHIDRFFITSIFVKNSGIQDFLGIDIDSSRDDVIRIFGEAHEIEGNRLSYYNDSGHLGARFVIENDRVIEMSYHLWF